MLRKKITSRIEPVSTIVRAGTLILVLFSSFAWADSLPANPTPDPIELNLLVYNTHGLPAIFARDRPQDRFPRIGNLTTQFDLSMLQEDFAHHDLLRQHTAGSAKVHRGENAGSSKCAVCSGSGLTFISNLTSERWQTSASFEPFQTCSGWLDRANDCFAQKGFQLIELTSSDGLRFYIVNTHLDAGRDQRDRDARAIQLEQIAQALETKADGAAVIVAGDLNLDWENPADRKLLQTFAGRLSLVLVQKGGDARNSWRTLDYIYIRSGNDALLSTADSGEVDAVTEDHKPLSDHPAMYATIKVNYHR